MKNLRKFAYENRRYDSKFPHDAWMVIAELGLGKTKIVIEVSSVWKRQVDVGPIGYAVPTLGLAEEVAKRYREQGIHARVFAAGAHLTPSISIRQRQTKIRSKCARTSTLSNWR